jgi:hypothetical protein
MNDPVQSERGAFRILQVAAGACSAVVLVKSVGGKAADAVAVSIITAAVLARLLLLPRDRRATQRALPARPPNTRHRILVIATADDISPLADDVRERTEEHDSDVMLICPALNSRLAHWVSDVDAAERGARERVEAGLRALAQAGVDTSGAIGDPDPLQAIEDALWTYGADEVVLATHEDGRLHWLEKRLIERVRAEYALPIERLVDAPAPQPSPVPDYIPVAALVTDGTLLATPAIASGAEGPPPMS